MSQLQPPDRGLVSVVVPAHNEGRRDGKRFASRLANLSCRLLRKPIIFFGALGSSLLGLLAELVVNVSERVDRLERRMTDPRS